MHVLLMLRACCDKETHIMKYWILELTLQDFVRNLLKGDRFLLNHFHSMSNLHIQN
jgi:hypothetical protein